MFGFVNRVDKVNWPPQRDSSVDIPSVSPSSERIKELCMGCVWFI